MTASLDVPPPKELPGEISLAGLLRDVWTLRYWVVALILACGLSGAAYAWLAPKWFRAEVVVTQANSSSPAAGGLGQLGGLASLAGINLSSGGPSQTPLAVLRSTDFARSFIDEHDLVAVILASHWDPAARHWKGAFRERPPDSVDAAKYFNRHVRFVSEDKRTGLITVSVRWRDAKQAAEWANLLVDAANRHLREQALKEAERGIQYLKAEIAATNMAVMQQSLGKLLEAEMQKLLLAKGNEEFAFKIIDKATVPRESESPRRALVAAGSLVAGLFASLLLVGVYRIRRELRAG